MLRTVSGVSLWPIALISSALLLTACNDSNKSSSDNNSPQPAHPGTQKSEGRLLLANNDELNPTAYIYDLETNKTIISYKLKGLTSGVYASPDSRYGVLLSRTGNISNFVDGGIFKHDDHIDSERPSLLPLALTGPAPTHYRSVNGKATIFYDGSDTIASSFDLLTDNSLKSNKVAAFQALPQKHHGVAEPRGNYVLSTYLPAGDSELSKVAVYELHNDHFHFENVLPTPCNKLHGAASSKDYSAFGCEDGILLVQQSNNQFKDSKIAVNIRITNIAGHQQLNQFVGFATGNLQAFVIDPVARSSTALNWSLGAQDSVGQPVARVQHLLDSKGEHLVILDNTGVLHVISTSNWRHLAAIKVLDKEAALAKLALNRGNNEILVSDVTGKAVISVSLKDLKISQRISLDFAPVGVAWLGAAQ